MAVPRAGRDYPRTTREFRAFFPNERAALQWLMRLRWPAGWRCGACGSDRYWWRSRDALVCAACRASTTPLAGTLLTHSRIEARDWLDLAWRMTTTTSGVSTSAAAQELGVSPENTWHLMHKLRRAMASANASAYPMAGPVEVDEAFLGGPRPGVPGRGALGKQLLLIIVGRKAKHGKVYIERVPDAAAATLLPIVSSHVRPGAQVATDGHPSYQGLSTAGFRHTAYPISRLSAKAHHYLPSVHSVASRFKRTWLDVWGGGISADQLPWYLAEFCFRYNRRHYKHRGRIFYDLMAAVLAEPHRTALSVRGGH